MTIDVKSSRDQIRAATLGSRKSFRSQIINLNGVDVEVRQVDVKTKNTLSRECRYLDTLTKQSTLDDLKFTVRLIIDSCFEPGTNNKVYDITDYDSFVSTYEDEFFNTLGQVVLDLNTGNIEEIKKN
jgi:hypothetical protein